MALTLEYGRNRICQQTSTSIWGTTLAASNRIEYPVSAGGVVYRVTEDGVEIVIGGFRSQEGWTWGLPKGTPDPGETMEETALREVNEETGLKVALEAPIDNIQYWFVRSSDGVRCHKTVHFYLMSPIGGSISEHDQEFDAVHWRHDQEALRTLTYRNEANIVEKAMKMVSRKVEEEKAID